LFIPTTTTIEEKIMDKLDLKVGDRVRLRDGTIATVTEVRTDAGYGYPFVHDHGVGPGGFHAAHANGKSCLDWDHRDIVAKLDDAA
jgi:hypothetical protein